MTAFELEQAAKEHNSDVSRLKELEALTKYPRNYWIGRIDHDDLRGGAASLAVHSRVCASLNAMLPVLIQAEIDRLKKRIESFTSANFVDPRTP